MRNPKVRELTSLEEDFKNIGILDEEDDASTEVVEDGEEELDEARRIRRQFRGGKVITTKRTGAKERRKARMWRRSSKGKAALRKRKRKMRKASEKRKLKRKEMRAKKRGTREESLERVNNILEDVQSIVSSLDEADGSAQQLENAIKAFANVAIISEMLANFFSEGVELVESAELSDELAEAAIYFAEQAEQAAFLATALEEGTELDEDLDVDALFQEQMDSLVEGLEFYADMTEDEEVVEDEEELDEGKSHMERLRSMMDDEDEDDDEGNGDDEDDEEY